jgi:radical SAM protein with 4Fe4S-binding SPASM domain
MIKVAQIDPNGLCNSKCWFCPVAYEPNPLVGRKNMSLDTIENILKQLRDGVGDFVDPNYGLFWPSHFNEVLLYPNFEEMVMLYEKYNFPIIIFSNGVNLTKEKIDIIKKYPNTIKHMTLNIPSAFKEQWSQYTGFNIKIFDKLMNNLFYAYKELDSFFNGGNFSIQVNNFNNDSINNNGITLLSNAPKINLDNKDGDLAQTIKEFKKIFPKLNVFQDNALIDRSSYLKNINIFSNENYLKRISDSGNKKVVGCIEKRAEEFLHISANGDVFLCCCDYKFETVFGNIYNNTIKEIWESIERKQMIDKSFSDFCRKCANAIWE